MPDRFVRLARTRLDVSDLDLARNLGVTVGCLRSWDRKGGLVTSSWRRAR
jgi:DNA-binding transcriptional regulator YiaG